MRTFKWFNWWNFFLTKQKKIKSIINFKFNACTCYRFYHFRFPHHQKFSRKSVTMPLVRTCAIFSNRHQVHFQPRAYYTHFLCFHSRASLSWWYEDDSNEEKNEQVSPTNSTQFEKRKFFHFFEAREKIELSCSLNFARFKRLTEIVHTRK